MTHTPYLHHGVARSAESSLRLMANSSGRLDRPAQRDLPRGGRRRPRGKSPRLISR